MTTVLLLHTFHDKIGVTALYPDTDEGLDEAIKHMKNHIINSFNKTDLVGDVEHTSIKRSNLPLIIRDVFSEDKDPEGDIVVSFQKICNDDSGIMKLYTSKKEKWEIVDGIMNLSKND